MKSEFKEISKEDYDRYSKMSHRDFNNEIEKTIPIQWACGYGWYGAHLIKDKDKYFIEHRLGSSCD